MTSTRHSPPKARRMRRGVATVLAGVLLACAALPLAADQTQFPFSGTVKGFRHATNSAENYAELDGTGAYLWTDFLGSGAGVAFQHYLTVTSDGVITSYAGTHYHDFDITDQWAADDAPRLGYYELDNDPTWWPVTDFWVASYDIDDEPLGSLLLEDEDEITWGWSGWFIIDVTGAPSNRYVRYDYDFSITWSY